MFITNEKRLGSSMFIVILVFFFLKHIYVATGYTSNVGLEMWMIVNVLYPYFLNVL